jgi:hypothetical protein
MQACIEIHGPLQAWCFEWGRRSALVFAFSTVEHMRLLCTLFASLTVTGPCHAQGWPVLPPNATVQSKSMAARADSPFRVFPSAANGYYVMLAPLAPGKHVLNFGGALPSMGQAITYTLVVE